MVPPSPWIDDDNAMPQLLPEPWRAQRTPGCVYLESPVTVLSIGDAGEAAELLASEFRSRGLAASSSSSPPASSSPAGTEAGKTPVNVSITVAPGSTPSLQSAPLGASEGYELEITPRSISIRASSPAGAFYAVQTVRQLLPVPTTTRGRSRDDVGERREQREREQRNRAPLALPCLEVADAPRFAWRGLLLDVARHFFDARFVSRLLAAAASLKMNVLHLHLVDDQGWRLPPAEEEAGGERGRGERGRGVAQQPSSSPSPPSVPRRPPSVPPRPPPAFCESYPLLSRLGPWRGESRREAREWRAARRKSRRDRRRERAEGEDRREPAEDDGGEGDGASGRGSQGRREEESDEDISGASPSSSEATSDDGSVSGDAGDGGGGREGSCGTRPSSPERVHRSSRVRAGGCYSTRDLAAILEAAAARHVTVVPEVDLPGHCGAAIACYPELACGGGGRRASAATADDDGGDASPAPPLAPSSSAVPTLWGVHGHVLCASSGAAKEFAGSLLSDVAGRMFPRSPFVHVGGDEVPLGPWEACEGCRRKARDLLERGIAEATRGEGRAGEGGRRRGGGGDGDAAARPSLSSRPFRGEILHSWFVSEAERTLKKHGRRAVVWCDAFDAEESARAAVASAAAAASAADAAETSAVWDLAAGDPRGARESEGREGEGSSPGDAGTPRPASFFPSSSAVVMCWRGGGAPGARAAAAPSPEAGGGGRSERAARDVVMCPATRCYLDYRNEDSPGEPGAWYAKLTLRDCWEFDPLVVDEAVEVEAEERDGEGDGGRRMEGNEEGPDGKERGPTEGGRAAASPGAAGEGEELGEARRAQGTRSASSSMAEVDESQALRGSVDGDGDDGDVVSSHLPGQQRRHPPPQQQQQQQQQRPPSPPRDAPFGSSLAMASSASAGGAASMSGAFGGAAAGGNEDEGGEEEEVVGPAESDAPPPSSPGETRRKVVLRRVPLPESSRARVLGGQACLWTEYCPDERTAGHLLFPRLLATAEALWSPALRERRGYARGAPRGGGSTGSVGGVEEGAEGDDASAKERAWEDFVERARAQGPRLEAEGWHGRKF